MKTSKSTPLTALAVTLVSARLTRLVTTDKLGQWLIQEPVAKAMDNYADRLFSESADPKQPWWWKYQQGLTCPWCVGFWATLGTVAVERTTRKSRLRPLVEVLGAALATNYLSASLEVLNPANSHVEAAHESSI